MMDKLILELKVLYQEAMKQERYNTAKCIDYALKIAGWELASKLGDKRAGKQVLKLMRKE